MNGNKLIKYVPEHISLAYTDSYIFYSEVIGKSYRLFIAKPENIDTKDPLPVVYILDANSTFLLAVQMIRLLQYTNELPPMLIVGVGYDDEDPLNIVNRRLQEFTPTVNANYKNIWRSQLALSSDGGDASKLLRFFEDELKPFIASSYAIDQDNSTLVGDSLGGLFTLYALLKKPAMFNRYVIGSPVIFRDKDLMWDLEEHCASEHQDLNAHVFIGVGGEEDNKPYHFPEEFRGHLSNIDYVQDSCKMAEKLISRNYPSLKVSYLVFEGETHMSVISPLINRGLRMVFQDITGKKV